MICYVLHVSKFFKFPSSQIKYLSVLIHCVVTLCYVVITLCSYTHTSMMLGNIHTGL